MMDGTPEPTAPSESAGATTAKGAGCAVDQVVHAIRDLIAAESLGVGDKLPTERELCIRFSASRNTVREAMRMLKAFGIVEVRPKVGATIVDHRMNRAIDLFAFNVAEISRQTFDDIQSFRELIEVGSVLPIFDAATPETIATLRHLNQQMVQAKSIIEASEWDLRLHLELIGLTRNKSILDVYGIMTPVILRIMQRGKTRRNIETQTSQEHEAVIDAIERRDSLAYQYLMRTHLRAGQVTFSDSTAETRRTTS